VPATLDWDLWLGPALDRPYSEGVHPARWRAFWDFGGGHLGDFGCHYMDLVHWALGLRHPDSVEAKGPPPDAVSTPAWLEVAYRYPARQDKPAVALTWHGGRVPEQVAGLQGADGKPLDWGSGQLFIGSKGMLVSDYNRHLLLPVTQFQDYTRPAPFIADSPGHHAEWINAIRNGGLTTCNFDYSGPLTEAVLLGSVSYRSGERLDYDGATGTLRDTPRATAMLHKEYRTGWNL